MARCRLSKGGNEMENIKDRAVFFCCKKYDYQHLHEDEEKANLIIGSFLDCEIIDRCFDYSECEHFYRRYMMKCLLEKLMRFKVLVVSDFKGISQSEIERKVFAATLALFDAKVVQINGMNTLESDPEYEAFVKNKIQEIREKDPISVDGYSSYAGTEIFIGNVVRGMIAASRELERIEAMKNI